MKSGIISYYYNYSLVANRYYNPRISQFYATDPLAEKYPGMPPYTYTADNPVMLVDPDGRRIIITHKGKSYVYKNNKLFVDGKEYKGKLPRFVRKTFKALNKLSNAKTSEKIIKELIGSKYDIQILHYRKNHREMASVPTKPSNAHAAQIAIEYFINPSETNAMRLKTISEIGSGSKIYFDPNGHSVLTTKGMHKSASATLFHELIHSYDFSKGTAFDWELKGERASEWNAIYFENLYRKEMNYPLRQGHKIQKIIDEEGSVKYIPTAPKMLDEKGNPIHYPN